MKKNKAKKQDLAGDMPKRKPFVRVPIEQEPYSFDDQLHTMQVARISESGSDMIKSYGKIEAVVEMYEEGPLNIHQAFIRILEIVKGKGVV